MKGYIIRIRIDNYKHNQDTFLYVDEKKRVRSIFDEEGLPYCTKEERWIDGGVGILKDKPEKGLYVSVAKDNAIVKWNDRDLIGKVLDVHNVNIEEEAKEDAGIVGIDRPAFKPQACN